MDGKRLFGAFLRENLAPQRTDSAGFPRHGLSLSFLQDDSTGEMIFDEVFHALSRCLAGLAQPFQVPGTDQLFRPKIFVTILAYSSIIGLASHQVWSFWVELAEETPDAGLFSRTDP